MLSLPPITTRNSNIPFETSNTVLYRYVRAYHFLIRFSRAGGMRECQLVWLRRRRRNPLAPHTPRCRASRSRRFALPADPPSAPDKAAEIARERQGLLFPRNPREMGPGGARGGAAAIKPARREESAHVRPFDSRVTCPRRSLAPIFLGPLPPGRRPIATSHRLLNFAEEEFSFRTGRDGDAANGVEDAGKSAERPDASSLAAVSISSGPRLRTRDFRKNIFLRLSRLAPELLLYFVGSRAYLHILALCRAGRRNV